MKSTLLFVCCIVVFVSSVFSQRTTHLGVNVGYGMTRMPNQMDKDVADSLLKLSSTTNTNYGLSYVVRRPGAVLFQKSIGLAYIPYSQKYSSSYFDNNEKYQGFGLSKTSYLAIPIDVQFRVMQWGKLSTVATLGLTPQILLSVNEQYKEDKLSTNEGIEIVLNKYKREFYTIASSGQKSLYSQAEFSTPLYNDFNLSIHAGLGVDYVIAPQFIIQATMSWVYGLSDVERKGANDFVYTDLSTNTTTKGTTDYWNVQDYKYHNAPLLKRPSTYTVFLGGNISLLYTL